MKRLIKFNITQETKLLGQENYDLYYITKKDTINIEKYIKDAFKEFDGNPEILKFNINSIEILLNEVKEL
jgi:hypothetical protein